MKVKIFTSISEKSLENKVNDFIQNNNIEVKDIQYSSSVFYVSVCIVYMEK